MMTIACHRKKNWVKKAKTQRSLGVSKNIENFDHNLDFDDGPIWKSKMLVWNLLYDDKSLPQEKKLVEKSKNLDSGGILGGLVIIINSDTRKITKDSWSFDFMTWNWGSWYLLIWSLIFQASFWDFRTRWPSNSPFSSKTCENNQFFGYKI